MTEIRCVIFDLCRTLLMYRWQVVLARLSRLTGKSVDEVYKFIGWGEYTYAVDSSLVHLWDLGLISDDEFFGRICSYYRITEPAIQAQVRHAFTNCFELPNDVRTLLHFLGGRHIIVGLLSNINQFQWRHIRQTLPVFGLQATGVFDFQTLSWEEHHSKPGRPIFDRAFSSAWRIYWKLTCRELMPYECLFVDDVSDNIEAAEKFGMHGELVYGNGYPDIAEVFKHYNIALPPKVYYPHSEIPEKQPKVIISHNAPH